MQEQMLARKVLVQLTDGLVDLTAMSKSERETKEQFTPLQQDARKRLIALDRVKAFFGGNEAPNNPIETERLCFEIASRSTSHRDDVEICMAHLLGLDVKQLFGLASESRLQAFYRQMKHAPTGFVFGKRRKMTTAGFRWAPMDLRELSRQTGATGRVTKDGFILRCAGFLFEGTSCIMPGSVVVLFDAMSGKGYALKNESHQEIRLSTDTRQYNYSSLQGGLSSTQQWEAIARPGRDMPPCRWALLLETADFNSIDIVLAVIIRLEDARNRSWWSSNQQEIRSGALVGNVTVVLASNQSEQERAEIVGGQGERYFSSGKCLAGRFAQSQEWCVS